MRKKIGILWSNYLMFSQVAKQFQEQLQPLVEWLGSAERQVKALELVPTDEEKIQQKIREHKVRKILLNCILMYPILEVYFYIFLPTYNTFLKSIWITQTMFNILLIPT